MNSIAAFTAFFLGAVHALEPGHNKAAIAAFAIGHRSSLRHVFVLGFSTALAHTATILVLGLVLGATVSAADNRIHQYIEIGSAILIIATGVWLWRRAASAPSGKHDQHETDHPHETGCSCHPQLKAQEASEKGFSLGVIGLIGLSSGLIPCPTALAVLLSAMTSGHLASGLWTICLFSAGIALTLCAVAVLANAAARSSAANNRFAFLSKHFAAAKYAPLIAAWIVTASGCVTLLRAIFIG